MATFDAQALTNLAWAFSRAGVDAPLLFDAVAAKAAKKIATFTPKELVDITWAYRHAGIAAPALSRAAAAADQS
ncbi:hypothetical protein M885DRAFT_504945 [Pelagophyceae sp. CCMP2097]|nr:hypothetical protein M885DRAFT_504945 [Pelagophyceae sp. CCMP2097]